MRTSKSLQHGIWVRAAAAGAHAPVPPARLNGGLPEGLQVGNIFPCTRRASSGFGVIAPSASAATFATPSRN
jgi:hypothetical protein